MSPAVAPPDHHANTSIARHTSSSSSRRSIHSFSKKLMPRSMSSGAADRIMRAQPSLYLTSSSSSYSSNDDVDTHPLPLFGRQNWGSSHVGAASAASPIFKLFNPISAVASLFRSFFPVLQSLLIPTCQMLTMVPTGSKSAGGSASSRRKVAVTGTFFGQRKGRVSFAVQETPRSEPVLLLELATSTSHLVKEMASGMVRILLECDRRPETTMKAAATRHALCEEPVWTMYCNGHKLGHAISRECTASDVHVLSMVQTVSVGAGVIPASPTVLPLNAGPDPGHKGSGVVRTSSGDCDGAPQTQIMYMRAKFDRVIGSRDSEAFYMINPDCNAGGKGGSKFNNGGPELSIFLLRI